MRALGVPVEEASTGHWVVRSSLRAETDAALYVEELQAIAWAEEQSRWTPLQRVVSVIDNSGYTKAGLAVTTPDLQKALRFAARTAQSQASVADPAFAGIRIIRALGLLEGHDIAKLPAAKITRLDPLQALLVAEEFTLRPLLETTAGPSGRTRLPRLTHHVVKRLPAAALGPGAVCEDFKPILKPAVGKVGALLTGWLFVRKKVVGTIVGGSSSSAKLVARKLDKAAAAKYIKDLVHAVANLITISVTYSRPEGPIPLGGPAVRFGIKVEEIYEWPVDLIECGYLLGVDLPKKGDVPGVEVLWFPGRLTDFGAVSPGLATGGLWSRGTTNDVGWAYLTFTPGEDPTREGTLVSENGKLPALAMVNGPVAADPSWLTGGYFDTMRMQIMAWQITYHLPTGLSVEMSVAHDYSWHNEYDQSGSGSGTYRLSGSWKRKVGAAGQLAYTIATGSSELHKASSLGGSCGADPPEENGVCDWITSITGGRPGTLTVSRFTVDPKTGKPLDVTLTGPYDGLPVETGTASCTGDCDPDASGPTTGYDVAAVLTSKYGSTDPVRIDLRGWVKDKGTGDWLLRQSYEETSDIMLSGTQHYTAVITWRISGRL